MQRSKKLELPTNHTTSRNMAFVTADQTTALTSASSCGQYLMLPGGWGSPVIHLSQLNGGKQSNLTITAQSMRPEFPYLPALPELHQLSAV